MDIQSILLQRRTIHDYDPSPLPEGALERALIAALAAPNHRMTEPWRFVRVGPETRSKLCEVSVGLKTPTGAAPRADLVEKTRKKMLNPAELLVVSRVRADDPEVEREDYAAIACAIQNLSLSLWAEDVGSKWSTGEVTTAAETYALVGIDERLEEIVGFVWVGKAASNVPKARRRRELSDVLRQLP
jgi:nitroreductase